MTDANPPSSAQPFWVTGCAAVWVVVLLGCFFDQVLPNNSSAVETLTRGQIWEYIAADWPTILNPLDYSEAAGAPSGWHNVGQRVPFIRTAIMIWFAAWCLGRLVIGLVLGPVQLLRSERTVFDFGVGISLLTLWTLVCGVAGQLHSGILLAPSGVAILVLVITRIIRFRSTTARWPIPQTAVRSTVNRGMLLLLIVLPAPFVLHIFLGGMTPPFDFDVCEYHLQGPREWLQHGSIQTLEHNVYTCFPFLSEMVSLQAMVLEDDWWRGAIAGKLALSSFQFLSAICVFAICQRWIGIVPGFIAAIALLSTPWTTRISIIAYSEGAITFYLVASLMGAMLVAATNSSQHRWRLVALTGFLSGSAMAAKYPGLVSVVIPVAMFVAWSVWHSRSSAIDVSESGSTCPPDPRDNLRSVLCCGVIFVFAVILAVGPWLFKNAAATGNPVYPLAYSVFGAKDWSPEMDAKWQKGHSPDDYDLTKLPAHLMGVAVLSDWQNGYLFAFAIPALLLIRRRNAVRWLWAYVIWMLATWWALTHRIDRFWIPVIPVLAVCAGAAWQLSTTRFWRYGMILALLMCCVFNYGFCRLPVVGFHAGLMDMTEARKRPIRQDIRLLNSTLPPNARVLMVGEAAVFNATFDVVYNTVFDDSIFEQWTSAANDSTPAKNVPMKSTGKIRSVLRAQNITHIYVNWSEILRYRQTYGYTDFVTPDRFLQLQSMGLLAAPVTMSTGKWESLDGRQQAEVSSWQGAESLMCLIDGSRFWSSIQIFRVTL